MNRLAINIIVAFCLLLIAVMTLYGMVGKESADTEEARNLPAQLAIFGSSVVVPSPVGSVRLDRPAEHGPLLHFVEESGGRLREYLFTITPGATGPVTLREFKQWKEAQAALLIKGIQEEDAVALPNGFPRTSAGAVAGTDAFVMDGGDYLTSRLEMQGPRLGGSLVSVSGLLGDRPYTLYVTSLTADGPEEDPMPLAVAWRQAIRAANGID